MKVLQNPTTFFFKQAENIPDPYHNEIHKFADSLLNKEICELCRKKYDLLTNIPRIMIHCGHTFCTACLKKFYLKQRVRCPMCLKLVKNLDKVERLPINHTIYTYLVQKDKELCAKSGLNPIVVDASKHLFVEFQKAQKQAHLKQRPQKVDQVSGLLFCVFHPDRVEHFFCQTHQSAGCRICSEIGHSKPQCRVTDLYDIDDQQKLEQYLNSKGMMMNGGIAKHSQQINFQDEDIEISDDSGMGNSNGSAN